MAGGREGGSGISTIPQRILCSLLLWSHLASSKDMGWEESSLVTAGNRIGGGGGERETEIETETDRLTETQTRTDRQTE